jgi:uncharacterized Zn finger protein
MMETEYVRCPACGSRNASGSYMADDEAWFDCADCGSDWVKTGRGKLVALVVSGDAVRMRAAKGKALAVCGSGSLACSPGSKVLSSAPD